MGKSTLSLTVSANQAPQKCMQIPHQQLFDSRDAVVPPFFFFFFFKGYIVPPRPLRAYVRTKTVRNYIIRMRMK